jgi:hypothetical protein
MLILSGIGIAALIVCVVATIIFVPAAKSARRAYRELLLAEGDAIDPAREKYWALDKRQRRSALTSICCYAVGIMSILPFGNHHNWIQFTAVIGLTLLMWVVTFVSTFAKSDWQIQMEVDELKHQEKMRKLRENR